MPLLQELFSDLKAYYIDHHKTLANPNYVRADGCITWHGHLPREVHPDYVGYFRWVANNMQYSFQLEDGCCLQLYYQVHRERLVNASLSFLPSPSAIEEKRLVYFRFDCDLAAQRHYVHTSYHMHFGYPDAHCRLSVLRFPTPSDFIRFVMLLVYEQVDSDPQRCNYLDSIPDLDALDCKYLHCLHLL